jgi:hypothetical protein
VIERRQAPVCYSLRDREPEEEVRESWADNARERGRKPDAAHRAQRREKLSIEEVRGVISGVR